MTDAAATPRDVRNQTDISVMKTEKDGSFKRKAATFRNTIEKGGKFEPESGESFLYVMCKETNDSCVGNEYR